MTAALKLMSLGGGDFGGRRQQRGRREASKPRNRVTRSAGDGLATETPGRLKTNQASGVGDVSWPGIMAFVALFGMEVTLTRFSGVLHVSHVFGVSNVVCPFYFRCHARIFQHHLPFHHGPHPPPTMP